jgi:ABC-type nitrate/sulfonate/bicarbonate transport system substrate-binding protein
MRLHARSLAFVLLGLLSAPVLLCAAEKLIGIHSSRVLSQSMPWVAREAGLFKKYNLDFDLVFIASSPSVTAAMLGGDADRVVSVRPLLGENHTNSVGAPGSTTGAAAISGPEAPLSFRSARRARLASCLALR